MIVRLWHGWTEPGDADHYETLLKREILPGILAKDIPGLAGIEVLRRDAGDEIEFITLMRFTSREAIEAFVGADIERSYIPDSARRILKRHDARSLHYERRAAFEPSQR